MKKMSDNTSEKFAVDEAIEIENRIAYLNKKLDLISQRIELAEDLGLPTDRLIQRYEETDAEIWDLEREYGNGV
jgi:hypothetical protein